MRHVACEETYVAAYNMASVATKRLILHYNTALLWLHTVHRERVGAALRAQAR